MPPSLLRLLLCLVCCPCRAQVQSLSFVCSERRIKQDNSLASIIINLPPWVNWLTFDNAVTAQGLRYIVLLLQQAWKGHSRHRKKTLRRVAGSMDVQDTAGMPSYIGDNGADAQNTVLAHSFAGITGLAVRNHAFKLEELQPVIGLLEPPNEHRCGWCSCCGRV